MADIRINSLPSTATSFNTDDYIAIDGASGGTRKMLAATLPLTDVTFGSSGPSAKSSIAARASRQGLVFDGTSNGALVSVPAIGTGDFTAAAWLTPNAFTASIFGQSNGVIDILNATTMRVYDGATATSYNITIPAVTTGKTYLFTWTRSGTTLTAYVNGVAAGTTTCPLSLTAFNYLGSINTFNKLNGTIEGAYIYNRALSAAEVVALYEAGVPAGADYNTASNTAINTGAVANSSNVNFDYDTFTGASATGFTASVTSSANGSFATVNGAEYSVVTGTRYLVTFSATLTSGTAPKVSFGSSIVGTLSSNIHTVTAGSNSVILTLTATGSRPLYFYNAAGESASFAISSLSVTRLGLLLAPDAGQAGGGLTWYDTSGNAANITLPASGVTWNVPTSSKVATGWSFNGNIGIGTTSPTGYAARLLQINDTSGSTSAGLKLTNNTTGTTSDDGLDITMSGSTAYIIQRENSPLDIYTNAAFVARFAANGNYLLGTTTDGGQKLQVAGAIRSTGNIESATSSNGYLDLAVANTSAGTSAVSRVYAYNGAYSFALELPGQGFTTSGPRVPNRGYLYCDGAQGLTIHSINAPLRFWTGNPGTEALVIDTSQNATFAGRVTGTGIFGSAVDVKSTPVLYNTSGGCVMSYSGSGVGVIRPYANASGTGTSSLQISPSGTLAITFDASDVTISNGIGLKVGNAYVAGAPTATGYIVIKDSTGTSYKIPAVAL